MAPDPSLRELRRTGSSPTVVRSYPVAHSFGIPHQKRKQPTPSGSKLGNQQPTPSGSKLGNNSSNNSGISSVASSKRQWAVTPSSAPQKRQSAMSNASHDTHSTMPQSPKGDTNNTLQQFVYDPSLDLRSASISVVDKVPIGEHLVTDLYTPPPRRDSGDENKPQMRPRTPSEIGREWRRRIEEALRTYPRNTWGPVTKWGYLDVPPAYQDQKDHFEHDHDKMQKKRLESRKFGHTRHWVKYKDLTNHWEPQEARDSLAYCDDRERHLTDSEKMLHDLNDKRIARIKRIDEQHRQTKMWREFGRLEKREGEYLDKIANEAALRKDPGWRVNFSSVKYDIVTHGYAPGFQGDTLKYVDLLSKWRTSMRALRLQSKQSGARLYDVVTWKPQRPCCLPPAKPQPPKAEEVVESTFPRKQELPRPRNMLHGMDKVEDVPIGCTNDNRTNW